MDRRMKGRDNLIASRQGGLALGKEAYVQEYFNWL